MSFEELLASTTKECELFSNPIRALISLSMYKLREGRWADIKRELEEIKGPINPNTLSFHLGRLLESGLILKIGPENQPRYTSTEKNDKEINLKLGTEVIEKYQERISG